MCISCNLDLLGTHAFSNWFHLHRSVWLATEIVWHMKSQDRKILAFWYIWWPRFEWLWLSSNFPCSIHNAKIFAMFGLTCLYTSMMDELAHWCKLWNTHYSYDSRQLFFTIVLCVLSFFPFKHIPDQIVTFSFNPILFSLFFFIAGTLGCFVCHSHHCILIVEHHHRCLFLAWVMVKHEQCIPCVFLLNLIVNIVERDLHPAASLFMKCDLGIGYE